MHRCTLPVLVFFSIRLRIFWLFWCLLKRFEPIRVKCSKHCATSDATLIVTCRPQWAHYHTIWICQLICVPVTGEVLDWLPEDNTWERRTCDSVSTVNNYFEKTRLLLPRLLKRDQLTTVTSMPCLAPCRTLYCGANTACKGPRG